MRISSSILAAISSSAAFANAACDSTFYLQAGSGTYQGYYLNVNGGDSSVASSLGSSPASFSLSSDGYLKSSNDPNNILGGQWAEQPGTSPFYFEFSTGRAIESYNLTYTECSITADNKFSCENNGASTFETCWDAASGLYNSHTVFLDTPGATPYSNCTSFAFEAIC